LKSGSLNLLEPSGPVQASNGVEEKLIFRRKLLDIGEEIRKSCNDERAEK
jgi:hypothetical protein